MNSCIRDEWSDQLKEYIDSIEDSDDGDNATRPNEDELSIESYDSPKIKTYNPGSSSTEPRKRIISEPYEVPLFGVSPVAKKLFQVSSFQHQHKPNSSRRSLPASMVRTLFTSPLKKKKKLLEPSEDKVDNSPASQPSNDSETENPESSISLFSSPCKVSCSQDLVTNKLERPLTASQTITQLSSSSDDFGSTFDGSTPISEWLKKSSTKGEFNSLSNFERSKFTAECIERNSTAIGLFDSPQKDSNEMICEFESPAKDIDLQHDTEVIHKKRSLSQLMKRTLTRYNSSLKAFDRRKALSVTRSQLNDKDPSLTLIISKWMFLNNRHDWVYIEGYDDNVNSNVTQRCILKSTVDMCKSLSATTQLAIIIYPPWQDFFSVDLNSKVLFCVEFYQIRSLDPSKSKTESSYPILAAESTNNSLGKLEIEPMAQSRQSAERIDDHFPFWKLLPQSITTSRSLFPQLSDFKTVVNLSFQVLEIWNLNGNDMMLLVRDPEETFSLLFLNQRLIVLFGNLVVGSTGEIECVSVTEKITPKDTLPFFSILNYFGSLQRVYYNLRAVKKTTYTVTGFNPVKVSTRYSKHGGVLTFHEISTISFSTDRRFHIKARIYKLSSSESLSNMIVQELTDEGSFLEILTFKFDLCLYKIKAGDVFLLKYVRIFRGCITMDSFSLLQPLSQDFASTP